MGLVSWFLPLTLSLAVLAGCASMSKGTSFADVEPKNPASVTGVGDKLSYKRDADKSASRELLAKSGTADRKTDKATDQDAGTSDADDAGKSQVKTGEHDAATLALINQELQDATPEERVALYRELKGQRPDIVRQILRVRRVGMNYRDEETLADGKKPAENRPESESSSEPETRLARLDQSADMTEAEGDNSPPPSTVRLRESFDSPTAPRSTAQQRAAALLASESPTDPQSPPISQVGYAQVAETEPATTGHSVGFKPDSGSITSGDAWQSMTGNATTSNSTTTNVTTTNATNTGTEPPGAARLDWETSSPTTLAAEPGFAKVGGTPAGTLAETQLADASAVPQATAPATPSVTSTLMAGLQRATSNLPGIAGTKTPPPATATVSVATSKLSWNEHLAQMIAESEQEVAGLKPGTNEMERQAYLEKHVYLRMLYLMSGQQERALQAIPGIGAADQEFWQQTFWGIANYFDTKNIPSGSDRAARTVTQFTTAVLRLQQRANLELRNVAFCHKIASFGNYDRFPKDEFSPGQPVLLYAELGNFHSEPTADGQFRTILKSTLEIYRPGSQGELVERLEFPATEDICRNHRRDYFHSYEFTISPKLSLGPHVLKLTVEDQLSRKVATYSMNFMVK